jgi:hypothetical protein
MTAWLRVNRLVEMIVSGDVIGNQTGAGGEQGQAPPTNPQ